MSNSKRWFSIAFGSILATLLLVGVLTIIPTLAQGPGGMMGGGMMNGYGAGSGGYGPGSMMDYTQTYTGTRPFGPGMMGGYGPGWMMGNTQSFSQTVPFGPGGMMNGGMMGGGMMGMGHGMMWNSNNAFYTLEPLTLAEATSTLDAYLATLNDSNLAVEDIMIFDNHAYTQIVEKDSGIGVMEVLVDPTTKAVYPEMGPNMMWNQKYGMMAGYGRYGMMGMMGGQFGFNNQPLSTTGVTAEMPFSPAEAVETAQSYVDSYFSSANLTVDEHADPFYGYYTLHVNRDGETAGMLSVNGYTGQIFPHTWHGKLLEMSGEETHE